MLTTFGDMALATMLRNGTARAKTEMARHAQELTTGAAQSPARHLGGDLSAISAMDRRLTLLAGHDAVLRAATLQFAAVQTGLDRLADAGNALETQLRISVQSNLPDALAATSETARGAFDDAVAILNTQVAGRTLFAGTSPEGPALAPAADILASAQAAASGAPDAAAWAQAIRDWFDDPAGFASTGYLGGARAPDLRLSPEARIAAPETALAPAITSHLAALAIGSLAGSAPQATTIGTRQQLARDAADTLLAARGAIVALQARTGTAEARVAEIETQSAAERSSLTIARAELLGVDPFEAATRLEDARGRVEALHVLTARLSRLSLLEYLR